MSNKNYLNMFLGVASAIGGAYLLNRFIRSGVRENSTYAKYTHVKQFEDFTDTEKEKIATRYVVHLDSTPDLAEAFGASVKTIQRILAEKGCELRDRIEASRLKTKKELSEDQKKFIKAKWGEPESTRPSINSLSRSLGVDSYRITQYLVEEDLFKRTKKQELTDDDVETLIAAKKEANAKGVRLNLNSLAEDLGLSRPNISSKTLLRFFAEQGLNRPCDYTGELKEEEQKQLLSYFSGGKQTRSIKEIAEAEGLSAHLITTFLLTKNIVPQKGAEFQKLELDDGQKALLMSMLEEGKTNREIAAALGVHNQTASVLIDEYRASVGSTESRRAEVRRLMMGRLKTQAPDIIEFIVSERKKDPQPSYEEIATRLEDEKGISIGGSRVRRIHIKELGKQKQQ